MDSNGTRRGMMGKHRKKNQHGADAAFDGSLTSTQKPSTEAPQAQSKENVTSFFHRMRAEQKAASAAATQRLAAKRAEAEKLTHLGEAQLNESNALINQEAAERKVLEEKMRRENPETLKVVRAFVQEALNRAIHNDEKRKAEKSLVNRQEMLHRHSIGDQETKEVLSIWSKFEKKPSGLTSEQKQRIAERNQDAVVELRRRNEAAKAQRMGLFSHSKRSSSPTFEMVGNEEAKPQSTPSQPKRW
jgi:hypothetical protein